MIVCQLKLKNLNTAINKFWRLTPAFFISLAINKTLYIFAHMNDKPKPKGRPKKEETQPYYRRLPKSKYGELAPKLDEIINQTLNK